MKKCPWIPPRTVLSYVRRYRTINVRGTSGRNISVAIEDVRLARTENGLASFVHNGIDKLCSEICDGIIESDKSQPYCSSSNPEYALSHHAINAQSSITDPPIFTADVDRVEGFWTLENVFYPGTVNATEIDWEQSLSFEGGDCETLDLSLDNRRFVSDQKRYATATILDVQSTIKLALRKMMDHFGNRSFLLH